MSALDCICTVETPTGPWRIYCSRRRSRVQVVSAVGEGTLQRLIRHNAPLRRVRGRDLFARIAWQNSLLLVRYRQRRQAFDITYSVRLELPTMLPETAAPSSRAKPAPAPTRFERIARNPLLEPVAAHAWESLAVFNPAAVYLNSKVHLLYRAIGHDGVSVLGYAASASGEQIDERLPDPVFTDGQTLAQYGQPDPTICAQYQSGISTFGCEDPRLTQIEDRLYMTYTAYDGRHPPGVGLTSIAVDDFLAKRWRWRDPVLISEPHQAQKNWVLFPERINDRYALVHGISPSMQIDFFDDLDFSVGIRVRSRYACSGNEGSWDSRIRGVGPPPVRTGDGWLVLYHAMDHRDPGRYKLGAMLLDLNNPFKILARSSEPLLEPDARCENEGFKRGVVYACGSAVIDNHLHVYYGGADTVVCCAKVELSRLLSQLHPVATTVGPMYSGREPEPADA